jgi:hypothetical protein
LGESEPAAWGQLKDEIVSAVLAELKRLLSNGAALSTEDVFVIVMGKALSVYSRHYPKVMREGQPISLSQAINEIEELVDEQIDTYFGMVVPPWLDMVSRVYLQHLARRPAITRDNLVKACRTRNIDFAELEHDYRYIRRGKSAGTYAVLSPDDRLEWLEKQVKDDPDTLTPIDRAHYLFALYRANRPVRSEIPRVYSDGLEEVCEALYHVTRDKAYLSVAKEVATMKDQGLLHR